MSQYLVVVLLLFCHAGFGLFAFLTTALGGFFRMRVRPCFSVMGAEVPVPGPLNLLPCVGAATPDGTFGEGPVTRPPGQATQEIRGGLSRRCGRFDAIRSRPGRPPAG